MTLQRANIRNITTDLLRGATDAGDNVVSSRRVPNLEENLPSISVYTPSESTRLYSESPLVYLRDLNLEVEILTRAIDDPDSADACDAICDAVEIILEEQDQNADGVLGCEIEKIHLQAISQDMEQVGETVITSTRLQFLCTYVREGAIPIEGQGIEGRTMQAGWDVGDANDPDVEAEDIITVSI